MEEKVQERRSKDILVLRATPCAQPLVHNAAKKDQHRKKTANYFQLEGTTIDHWRSCSVLQKAACFGLLSSTSDKYSRLATALNNAKRC